jgi:serine-type D-Ala-D-Ala carboxypeptidase
MTHGGSFHSSSLRDAFERQELQFASAFSILKQAIQEHAFPAASVAVTHRGKLIALQAFGRFNYDVDNQEAAKTVGAPFLPSFGRSGELTTPSTLFDLASLTKVVATTSMAMLLYERGLLDLQAPVAAIIPEFLTDLAKDSRRKNVTLRMLLSHSSGLPAYEKLFLHAKSRDELLHAAFTTPLTDDPGSHAEYSDIGFIILAVALERLAGGDEEFTLDRFCQREIFAPLAMTNTTFNPPAKLRHIIAPTQDDKTFRHRIIQGEVQDENAFVLGGVAGHAGLFSTARDLAKFAHALLQGFCGAAALGRESHLTPRIFRPETIALFTRRESSPIGTTRALGWDTPSSPSQSGKYFSENSFGHLGYTGTSLWIDTTRQLSVTLLTNRTWPDCSNQTIKQVRPEFHDATVEAVEGFH